MTATDKETGAIGSSNILECFQGAHVLVSGGMGFMGQVLMEKLLRNCQIGKLYVIVRPKKGLTEKERAEKIFGGVVSEYFVCVILMDVICIPERVKQKAMCVIQIAIKCKT
jgi:FlaA1/EpsC-like NDP-sugar epimerase